MKEKFPKSSVEGRDITANLKRYFDVDTYETRGSAITNKTLNEPTSTPTSWGDCLLQHPDFTANRRMIMTAIPTVQHAFLKRDEAVPKSKTKGAFSRNRNTLATKTWK